MSQPLRSASVAKEWRNVWQVAGFVIPEARTAAVISRCTAVAWSDQRPLLPVAGSVRIVLAGNRNCDPSS